MSRVSVFMIVQNEEKNIERSLRSAVWADEVVVLDGGSSDRTLALAKQFTDKVYQRNFTNFAEQKNHAMSLTSGEWLLSLDADEEITEPLKNEIRSIVDKSQSGVLYRISRRSQIFGRFLNYTGTQGDKPIRLFRKGEASFDQPIHEILVHNSKLGRLKEKLNHYTYPTLQSYFKRLNRYTSLEADWFVEKKHVLNFFDLSFKPALQFFRLYFLQQGFRDGLEGFLFSVLSAYYVFVKHSKEWQLSLSREVLS